MHIKIYRAAKPMDVPESLFWAIDGIDDCYWAAFVNYPQTEKIVVAAWGTTGEVAGEPMAVLIATTDNIITGYIDTSFDAECEPEKVINDGEPEPYEPIDHDEPSERERLKAMLTQLRRAGKAKWLLAHDADAFMVDNWLAHGFRVVEPPADIPAEEAVHVLVWGKPPEDVYTLLQARGLSWHRNTHRGYTPGDPVPVIMFPEKNWPPSTPHPNLPTSAAT